MMPSAAATARSFQAAVVPASVWVIRATFPLPEGAVGSSMIDTTGAMPPQPAEAVVVARPRMRLVAVVRQRG